MAILMQSTSEKWVFLRTDVILGKRKKPQRTTSEEYGGGGVPKLQCSFLRETDE